MADMEEESTHTIGIYEIHPRCPNNVMIGNRLICSTAGFSDSRDSARHHKMNEDNAKYIVKCVNSFESQAEEIKELRTVLKGLLEDTQHTRHNCGDIDCPVEIAQTALKGESK